MQRANVRDEGSLWVGVGEEREEDICEKEKKKESCVGG